MELNGFGTLGAPLSSYKSLISRYMLTVDICSIRAHTCFRGWPDACRSKTV